MKTNFLVALLLGCVLLTFGGCMDNKVLEGKEGLFAVIETENAKDKSKGEIYVELFYKECPLTVTNFVGLAEGTLDAAKGKPFYDGLKFHRVISKANGDGQDFMVQGGDPKGNGTGGPGYQFPDEIVDGLTFNKAGYLAMANAGSGRNGMGTNGSQFFITIIPTEWLNGHHTIFGEVVDANSQKVVDSLKQGSKIVKVTIVRKGADAEKFTATQEDWDKLYDSVVAAKKEAVAKAAAEKIAAVEKAFPGFDKDENGIYYKITKEGTGDKCGSRKMVSVEYKGYLVDGTVFDGSAGLLKGGHEPLDFMAGGGQMIPGFDIMVQDMKLGEVRTIVLPPELAYGDQGAGGVIPGGAYIAFDVELVKIK